MIWLSHLPVRLKLKLLLALIFCIIPAAGSAQPLEVDKNFYRLIDSLEFYIDDEQSLTIEQLINNKTAPEFSRPKGSGRLWLAPNTVVWLKIQLKFSEAAQGQRYIISALGGGYQDIRIYRPLPEGGFEEFITGDKYPAHQRELKIPKYGFVIDPQAKPMLIYTRVLNKNNMHLMHWLLMNDEEFNNISERYSVINFMVYGALIGVVLFGVGIGLTLRNKNFLYFSFYILAGALLLLPFDGIGFYWLWPNNPEFNQSVVPLLTLSVFIGRLLTVYGFMETHKHSPTLAKLTRYWLVFLGVCLFSVLCGLFQLISLKLMAGLWLVSMLIGIALNVTAIRHRVSLAWPFFFVLLLPIMVAMTQIANEAGWINIGVAVVLLNKLAFILHAFLFSIFIALKIKQEERSAHAAQRDHLTGLENLNILTARFKKTMAVAQRYRWQVLVMFIDLDKFKPVNDTYGHEVGDQLLKTVADRITGSVRNIDLVSRIGGDEFLVIQSEYKNAMDIHATAEKIIDELSRPFTINNQSITIGASIGVARYPHHGETLDELMSAADKAMYEVKRSGSHGVAVYGEAEEWIGD